VLGIEGKRGYASRRNLLNILAPGELYKLTQVSLEQRHLRNAALGEAQLGATMFRLSTE